MRPVWPSWVRMTTEPEQKPPTSDEYARFTSVDLGAAFDQFGDPGLLSEGKINLIALDAIVERLGPRWPMRRDQIHEHVDRTLHRRLGLQGCHLRVSETDFLICQPGLGRFSGQAICLQVLREILTHFVGDASGADNCVHQVTKVTADEIEGWPVRRGEVEEGERAEFQARAGLPIDRRTIDHWTPFVASDGRALAVTCSLEPVMELKSFRQIGLRIVSRVSVLSTGEVLTMRAIGRLSRADILRIDLATLVRGMERLRRMPADLPPLGLIAPLNFTTLSSQRGRSEVAQLLLEARGLVACGVICEMRNIDGVPPGVMLSVASLVRPYCLFVVAHVDEPPLATAMLRLLKTAGIQALSVECPQGLSDVAALHWIRSTIGASRRVFRSTLLYRVGGRRLAGLAAELGATHASFGPGLEAPRAPRASG